MTTRKNDLLQILDKHFNNLDAVVVDKSTIFKSEKEKEYYESNIMFALRKYESLGYHHQNVLRFIKKEKDDPKIKERDLPKLQDNCEFKTMMKRDAWEYIYEVSAFISSLKSCLDILSEASSFYSNGVDVNYSITPLVRLCEKKESVILDFIRKNKKWIKLISDYRHPLLHRLMINSEAGYEILQIGRKKSSVLYPMLIPKQTPKYVPDTRRTRVLNGNNKLNNSIRYESKSTINIRGDEKIHTLDVNYEPAEDYIKIEGFMSYHKSQCKKYFFSNIKLLDNLHFQCDEITYHK